MKRWMWICLMVAVAAVTLAMGKDVDDGFAATNVPDDVFARMQGKSYKRECRLKRSDLRYLVVWHVDAEGRRHKGEIVCHKTIAADLLDIFRELYKEKYPIERIRLIDDYDGDDDKSMRDNNTSAFNYRRVAGSKKLSKHSMGMAIDINPLYNPMVKRGKVSPDISRRYADRSLPFEYKITKDDPCVKAFKKHGFRWGGDWKSLKDYQHFEK